MFERLMTSAIGGLVGAGAFLALVWFGDSVRKRIRRARKLRAERNFDRTLAEIWELPSTDPTSYNPEA